MYKIAPVQERQKVLMRQKEVLMRQKEVPEASLAELLVEFTGTMFLALVVGLGGDAVSIGGTLAALVYAFSDVSGGHFNPAVTFAMLVRGATTWTRSLAYTIAQFAGAFTAAFVSKHVREEMNRPRVYPKRSTHASRSTAIGMEFLFTFAFVFVIVRVTAKSKPNSYYGAAIGLILAAAATVAAPISGAAFNPAIGVALPVVHEAYDDVWLYIFGPLMGATVAAVCSKKYK